MKIALAQINATLGNFELNAKKVIEYIQLAATQQVDVIVFPEASLFGYCPNDLLERQDAVSAQLRYLKVIQKNIPSTITAILGLFTKNSQRRGRPYYNSAAVLEKGKAPQFFHKQLLPAGDVFDENRFVESGDLLKNSIKIKGKTCLITICEDIWAWNDMNYQSNPLELLAKKKHKIDWIINISASPFYLGKDQIRKSILKKMSRAFRAPSLYVNMVGAQDELIFDGGSFSVNESGRVLTQASFFKEELIIIEKSKNISKKAVTDTELLKNALVLGIKDFFNKTKIKRAHLGLSGGVDSSLVACLAAEALGAQSITGISMPGPFSDPNSNKWARQLAQNLGISFEEMSIMESYQFFKTQIDQKLKIKEFQVLHENLQARIRGMLLMAYANHSQSLLLATGNKDELATGYCTLYGDMCGGLMPIGDLSKKQVYDLAALYPEIPVEVMKRPPSAELRPNQKDQDSLPPYEELDKSIENIIEKQSRIGTNTEAWLVSKLFSTEFKRWQAPPILKVSKHAFGRGRRFPIAHQWFEDNELTHQRK